MIFQVQRCFEVSQSATEMFKSLEYTFEIFSAHKMPKKKNADADRCNANVNAVRCKVCGKEGQGINIRDHIEANHLEGIILPCNLCDKTFRSRVALRLHNRQHQNKFI